MGVIVQTENGGICRRGAGWRDSEATTDNTKERFLFGTALFAYGFRVIGQKELVKTAVSVGIPIAAAVLSCFQEDTGRTKRVGKKPVKH